MSFMNSSIPGEECESPEQHDVSQCELIEAEDLT
jgi:hypothetical protein